MSRIIITSGFYNCLHVGHTECMTLARQLGDRLVVIVNNDHQVALKGSKLFMNQYDRLTIVAALRAVDEAVLSIDDDITVCKSIRMVWERYRDNEVIFAKGGDRFASNIPEVALCAELGIRIVDGLGSKIGSSSELLAAVKS